MRDVVGALHQGDLGRRFDDAAADRHRVAADELDAGQFLAQPVEHGEADALFDADPARRAPDP